MNDGQILAPSFRDPSGFVFGRDGVLLRQVNEFYHAHYDRLMNSGLCRTLVESGRLIAHEETDLPALEPRNAYKVIRPRVVPFVSYPYEWSFSQLKDAALLTLAIQKQSLDMGMSLKDASAVNIQFVEGRPVLIDTLSFENYRPGEPWPAYAQFCRHFLAPLALMRYRDARLGLLLRLHLDGVPLDLASTLLSWRSRLHWGLFVHLHLHALMQKKLARRATDPGQNPFTLNALKGLIDSLESTVKSLKWSSAPTAWSDYYDHTNYDDDAMLDKRQAVSGWLRALQPRSVWDLGANTGAFSQIAAELGISTMAFDFDSACVDRLYLASRQGQQPRLLPLLLDVTNPSPAIGWDFSERLSLEQRGPTDLVMALALVHHLAIANNVPLARIARFLHRIARRLIIEFVPKSDSQVARLLVVRADIFDNYSIDGFEKSFEEFFTIEQRHPIQQSERILYLMTARRNEADPLANPSSFDRGISDPLAVRA